MRLMVWHPVLLRLFCQKNEVENEVVFSISRHHVTQSTNMSTNSLHNQPRTGIESTAQPRSLHILHHFSNAFDDGLNFDNVFRDVCIVCFRTNGVHFAEQFLRQKIEFAPATFL